MYRICLISRNSQLGTKKKATRRIFHSASSALPPWWAKSVWGNHRGISLSQHDLDGVLAWLLCCKGRRTSQSWTWASPRQDALAAAPAPPLPACLPMMGFSEVPARGADSLKLAAPHRSRPSTQSRRPRLAIAPPPPAAFQRLRERPGCRSAGAWGPPGGVERGRRSAAGASGKRSPGARRPRGAGRGSCGGAGCRCPFDCYSGVPLSNPTPSWGAQPRLSKGHLWVPASANLATWQRGRLAGDLQVAWQPCATCSSCLKGRSLMWECWQPSLTLELRYKESRDLEGDFHILLFICRVEASGGKEAPGKGGVMDVDTFAGAPPRFGAGQGGADSRQLRSAKSRPNDACWLHCQRHRRLVCPTNRGRSDDFGAYSLKVFWEFCLKF